uniref:Putative phosphoglucosamine acetyltransferase n=1 Tax=Tabanus bromius TaxID=304241 RepID=A0A0K8TN31_TABBR
MKINETTQIIGRNVILIPYEERHVEKYHQWMQNPLMQELTASEPLTLEEEYQMQKSWRLDEDKCTFLILSKESYANSGDEIEALIGDTNLFVQVDDGVKTGEAEIMIAEESYQGKRLGWESMLLMLKYGLQEIGIKKFIAKIGEQNVKSINMFLKMDFVKVGDVNVFHEITLERMVTDEWIGWLNSQINYRITTYK